MLALVGWQRWWRRRWWNDGKRTRLNLHSAGLLKIIPSQLHCSISAHSDIINLGSISSHLLKFACRITSDCWSDWSKRKKWLRLEPKQFTNGYIMHYATSFSMPNINSPRCSRNVSSNPARRCFNDIWLGGSSYQYSGYPRNPCVSIQKAQNSSERGLNRMGGTIKNQVRRCLNY